MNLAGTIPFGYTIDRFWKSPKGSDTKERPQWTEKAITTYNTNHCLDEIHLFIVHLKDSFIVSL